MEQDKPGQAEHSPEKTPNHNLEGRTHHATSKEYNIPVDDAFIIPEEHSKQDKLHRKLLATARSLKKQKQRLKAVQDTLNRRWNKVLDTKGKHGDNRHTNSYPKLKLLPEFDNEAAAPVRPKNNMATQPDNQPMAAIEQPLILHTIYESSWTKRPVRPGPSTGLEDRLQRRIMVTTTIVPIEYQSGNNSQ